MKPSRHRKFARRVRGLQILRRKVLQRGFLTLESLTARNLYEDGKASPPYAIAVVHRRGLDCVSATLWFHRGGKIFVGVRRALRASLASRAALRLPAREKPRQWFWEAVAGSCEPGDAGGGAAALRRRMRREILEETGIAVPLSAVKTQGGGYFPSHGQSTEKIHLFAVEIPPQEKRMLAAPPGERGEEGASLHFVELDEAVRRCERGFYEDPKLEIGFRRLKAALGARSSRRRGAPR